MKGSPFILGDREFIVPRLRVGPYERAMKGVAAVENMDAASDPLGFARLTAVCAGIVELLAENYPALTVDEVKDLVVLEELDQAFSGVLAAAGKRKRSDTGEAVSP